MGEPERWQQSVEEFVTEQVGAPPARVLEVGCGEGELAHALARAGHSVTAVDPRAPEGPIFRRVSIEEFSDPDPFDCVVAVLSLHHVEDLGSALDRIASLLHPGGTLVVVEFAWDRIDGATAEWSLERLPALPPSAASSWLMRCCRGQRCAAEWAAEQGLHSSRRMRDELGRRFVERLFEWVPYLYQDLDEGTSEAVESAAIEAGDINATGFCYVGTLALGEQHPGRPPKQARADT
jgi:SAM-dependent methyltransferase